MAFNGDCPCLATDTQRLPLRNHANGGGYGCKQCGQGIPRHNRSSNTLVAAKLCRRSRAETRVYAAGEESRDRWNAALPYANLLLSPSINVSGVTLFFRPQKEGKRKRTALPSGASPDGREGDGEGSPSSGTRARASIFVSRL